MGTGGVFNLLFFFLCATANGHQGVSTGCCIKIQVAGELFTLLSEGNITGFACATNCVYESDSTPESQSCFTPGNPQVQCLEESPPISYICDRNCRDSSPKTCVFNLTLEMFSTPQVDGRERLVLAYNRIIPGPPIVVCEQDQVEVHVTNAIDRNLTNIDGQTVGTTLHLHGIGAKDRPWADGVPYVTQCPFPPGESFTYKFNDPPGTYWYHSHMGSHRTNGAYGALIIKEKELRQSKLYDIDESRNVLILQEWYQDLTDLAPVTLLVNGVGRAPKLMPIFDTDDVTKAIHDFHTGKGATFKFVENPEFQTNGNFLTNYTVYHIRKPGKRYLFRIIGAISQNFPLRVSIEHHKFTAIATDTDPVEPVENLTALWITAGERYDIVVHTKNDHRHHHPYKIKIVGNATDTAKTRMCTIAWLKYPGQTIDNDYITPADCAGFDISGGKTLNPVPDDHAKLENPENIFVDKLRDVKQQNGVDMIIPFEDRQYFDLKNQTFNNLRMTYPKVPFLLQDPEESGRCGLSSSLGSQPTESGMRCKHIVNQTFYAEDRWFETILINPNEPGQIAHPIHQHGGWFWVVGQGQFDVAVQQISREFIMEEDKAGNLSRNFNLPPPKDTIQVPTNGYVIYRTKLSNAGTWFVHCHIDFHLLNGMAMVLQIGGSSQWNIGHLQKNEKCNIEHNTSHEISWFYNMNPGTTRCIKPGERVAFIWDGKHHNVNELSKEDWENCQNFTDTTAQYAPFKFQAPNNEGSHIHYFACGVGDGFHCKSFNMKAKVVVSEFCP